MVLLLFLHARCMLQELSLIINGAFRFSTEILRCSMVEADEEDATEGNEGVT